MVFQRDVKLNIENKEVYANFDFDTGLIGFVEKVNDKQVEYLYSESPIEFKLAFFDALESISETDMQINGKISRKRQ